MIPLNKPFISKKEEKGAVAAIHKSDLAADGYFGEKLTRVLSSYLLVPYVFLTPSCSSALELAVRALGIGPGDEVIVPSFTMPATANAVLAAGARPVFAEIEKESLALDPNLLAKKITKKTKAIILVWYGGWVCQIEKIVEISKKYKLFLIEDAACALGTKVGKKFAGTFGDIGCFSFHVTKNIVCGEGGALVTARKELVSKINILRDHGTNRRAVLLGKATSYEWISFGGSYLLSDVLAAIALAQLSKIEKITKKRREIANYFLGCFASLAKTIWFPFSQKDKETNWHTFAMRVPKKYQLKVISTLKKKGVGAAFHYLPLHSSPFGKKLGYKVSDFPLTNEVAHTLVRLPIYPSLTKKEIDFIIKNVFDGIFPLL